MWKTPLQLRTPMGQKLREIVCLDETGQKVIVTEWAIGSSDGKHCTKEHRLEDGSPVTSLGGSYEHFYTGKMFRPL